VESLQLGGDFGAEGGYGSGGSGGGWVGGEGVGGGCFFGADHLEVVFGAALGS